MRTDHLLPTLVAIAGFGAISCFPPVRSQPQTSAPTAIVGYLETRDHRITLHGGRRYTIADRNGKVLARNVTLNQILATNPRLHGVLQRAVALDARR